MRLAIAPRHLVLLALSFVTVSAAIWIAVLVNAVSLETRIARDWMVLVERCRTSVEAGLPLDSSGLEPVEILRVIPETGTAFRERSLAFPNGRYAVVEREFAVRDGVQRTCAVRITDDRNGPTKREAAVLFYDFAQLSHDLYQAETHWGAEVLGGPQFASHAFQPREPRGVDCTVKSMILVVLETHDITMSATEMPGCSGPSFLSGESA